MKFDRNFNRSPSTKIWMYTKNLESVNPKVAIK